jgi:hypothetical protein
MLDTEYFRTIREDKESTGTPGTFEVEVLKIWTLLDHTPLRLRSRPLGLGASSPPEKTLILAPICANVGRL